MQEISFKERVKNELINEVKNYKQNLIDYEYLICSDAFKTKDCYIIDVKPENYLHLTGVNSSLNAHEFYNKCYSGTLREADFDFIKYGNNIKGTVRRKINVLPDMINIFKSEILAEEHYTKKLVKCSFATANNILTLGFINTSKCRPNSLIKGNALSKNRAKEVDLLLRKHITKDKFDEVIIGNSDTLHKYKDVIKDYANENLIKDLEPANKD